MSVCVSVYLLGIIIQTMIQQTTKEGDTMRAQNINLLLLFMDTIFFQDVYQHF